MAKARTLGVHALVGSVSRASVDHRGGRSRHGKPIPPRAMHTSMIPHGGRARRGTPRRRPHLHDPER